MKYRLASLADAEAIAELHASSWRRTYRGSYPDAFLDGDLIGNRRAVWRERLGRPLDNQFVCVAVDETRVAGFVCAFGHEDPEWGSLIDNLHVSHAFQRKGIASALMRSAGAWLASAHGDCGVYLWVLEANANARRFYERLGSANAETVEMENAGGGIARSCRYIWADPDVLASGGGRT